MEDLTRLVAESMARHGLDVSVDHRRLQWSKWVRCESSFDLSLLPSKPGLLALAEEWIPPGEMPMAPGKRMLAIFQIREAVDLGIALVRLFAPGTPLIARLAQGHVFVRYAVIEEESQRHSAHAALERWLNAAIEAASGIIVGEPVDTKCGMTSFNSEVDSPAPLPAGF
jgi:hypothetical protein